MVESGNRTKTEHIYRVFREGGKETMEKLMFKIIIPEKFWKY